LPLFSNDIGIELAGLFEESLASLRFHCHARLRVPRGLRDVYLLEAFKYRSSRRSKVFGSGVTTDVVSTRYVFPQFHGNGLTVRPLESPGLLFARNGPLCMRIRQVGLMIANDDLSISEEEAVVHPKGSAVEPIALVPQADQFGQCSRQPAMVLRHPRAPFGKESRRRHSEAVPPLLSLPCTCYTTDCFCQAARDDPLSIALPNSRMAARGRWGQGLPHPVEADLWQKCDVGFCHSRGKRAVSTTPSIG
jgi:hypothetical protein